MRTVQRVLVCVVVALGGGAAAQSAVYTYVGKDCGTASLTAVTPPKLGTSLTLRVTGSWAGVPEATGLSYLVTGASNTMWPGGALPATIFVPGFQPPCGMLRVSPDILLFVPAVTFVGPTLTTMSFPIPNSSALLGLRFYQQVVVNQQTCCRGQPSRYWLEFSRGGVATIGM